MSTTTTSSRSSMRSGGSREMCAATPNPMLSLVGASPSSSSSEGQRSRSNRGSSSDGEPQACDGFVNEDWRAGGPDLCTIPALTYNIPRTHPLYGRLVTDSTQLYLGVQSILDRADVNTMSIRFCGRQSKFEPEDQPTLTAFIAATKRSIEEDWISVSRSVRQFLHSQGILGISVEICDARALAPDFFYPLSPSDAVFPIWDRVLETILRTCDLTDWNSVGCYRIGKDEDRNMNPPTVIVTVDTSLPDWRPTRDTIVAILDSFNLPMVGVKIKRDKMIFGASSKPDLSATSLQDMLRVGHSIGRRGYRGSGTFGGWVQLFNSNTGRWHAFGITCSHVALPIDIPEIADFRIRGVSINENRNAQLFQLDSPTEDDLRAQSIRCREHVSALENRPSYSRQKQAPKGSLDKAKNASFEFSKKTISSMDNERKTFDAFLAQKRHYAGHVFCASGTERYIKSITHSKGQPTIIDWALIQVPTNRAGSNKVLTHGQYPALQQFPFDKDSTMSSGGRVNLAKEEYLYKCGRATEYTRGEWSRVRHAYLAKQVISGKVVPKMTFEYTITNGSNPFSLEGDPGSLVFNQNGHVVGMIIGGAESGDCTYITHIDDLFMDIKAATGATMVRIQGD